MRWSTWVWYASACGRTDFCVLEFIASWTTLSMITRSKVNELWPRSVTSSRTRPLTSGWSILTGYDVGLAYSLIVILSVLLIAYVQWQRSVYKSGVSLPSLPVTPPFLFPPSSTSPPLRAPVYQRGPTAKRFMVHFELKIMPLVTQNQQSTMILNGHCMQICNSCIRITDKSWSAGIQIHPGSPPITKWRYATVWTQ